MPKPNKLVLSTKKSIHPPLEIEIDGKTYQNNPFSRSLFEELKKQEKAGLAGDVKALYKQVELIYSIPTEVLDALDARDIQSLLQFTMAKAFGIKAEKTDEEQKEKKD